MGRVQRHVAAGVWILVLLLAGTLGHSTAAEIPQDLGDAVRDSARAAGAIVRIDSMLAAPQDQGVRRRLIASRLDGLLALHADAAEIVTWTDSALVNLESPYGLPDLCRRSTDELIGRRERLGDARRFIEAALAQCEQEPLLREGRGRFFEYRAWLQNVAGFGDSAVATVERGLQETREDHFGPRHSLLWLLASLQAEAGRVDEAIQAHLQMAGAAFQPDTSHMVEVRLLWVQRYYSLMGLDEALARERAASRHRMTFEAPSVDWELPALDLPTLERGRFTSASVRGHVAVIDFWGTWCRPCVESFPGLQRLHQRLRPRGVRFVAIDIEFEPKSLDEQRASTLAFMRKNHYSVPVALDFQGERSKPLYIPAFPTTWVVGRDGRVKFVNAGAFEGNDKILADQVESLLDRH